MITNSAVVAAGVISVGLAGMHATEVVGEHPLAETGTAQRRDSPFTEGDPFPDLALPSLADGSPTRLSDFRGTKVMLHVFASW